jgi:alpha-amylase
MSAPPAVQANPWNGKVVLQAFWWDATNQRYQTNPDGTGGWYTYLAKLTPRLKDMGFDGIWVPPPCKANNARGGNGYDLFDHYDLGQKFQKGSAGTRWGNQDEFLRLIAVAHANGLEVYPDIVLNHMQGGEEDSDAAGDKHKTFKYAGFGDSKKGRWPKSWLDFHPNPHHSAGDDNWRKQEFGPDICYHGRCCDHECASAGTYMRDHARAWFVWFRKQTDVDGFRFDAVKGFPPEVTEDLLYNAMDAGRIEADQRKYFAVAEHPANSQEQHLLDGWADQTRGRCGTFDFAFRDALSGLVAARGFFDMGSLPNLQQRNRFKTVPFVNNHDTWRGVFSDSSGNGRSDHSGDAKNGDELFTTINPDGDWAKVAHAAMFAIDGSPQVYYEDLFVNSGDDRKKADPDVIKTRSYIENLVWCHQKLDFKEGAYKVRRQGSQDLLVIERSRKAVIGLNDNGNDSKTETVETDFGPDVELHDYSGANQADRKTDEHGRLKVTIPAKGYCVWGPKGISGRFSRRPRRTTQEFQLDDDLGDNDERSLQYGGRLTTTGYRTGGSIWAAKGTKVKLSIYLDEARAVKARVLKPAEDGHKASDQGEHEKSGDATATQPLFMEFTTECEGYHQLCAALSETGIPTRGYLKVEYEAPATTDKY